MIVLRFLYLVLVVVLHIFCYLRWDFAFLFCGIDIIFEVFTFDGLVDLCCFCCFVVFCFVLACLAEFVCLVETLCFPGFGFVAFRFAWFSGVLLVLCAFYWLFWFMLFFALWCLFALR